MEKSIEKILEEIYADSKVTPSEVVKFRNKINDIAIQIIKSEGTQGILEAFCKSIDVSIQLLQETLLKLKRGEYTGKTKTDIHHLLEAYIQLLKVNFDAFK
jgi:predicted nucleic acid-binding protein